MSARRSAEESGTTLGILAGGGELPIAVAEAVQRTGRSIFVIALEGMASAAEIAQFPHAVVSIGELGKIVKLLKGSACSEITFAGRVPRPKFSELKVDSRLALALPRIVMSARKGDDALLRTIIGIFENEGFRVVGTAEAASDLLAPGGLLGTLKPSRRDNEDIERAMGVVRAMGALDIGQAAVVCEGLVLAVEASEGTDALLRRVAELPVALRGTESKRRGVLVKAPKPEQERRIDLPVLGTDTLELAAKAGLAGIAFQAGSTLILDRENFVNLADRRGVFVLGFPPGDDVE